MPKNNLFLQSLFNSGLPTHNNGDYITVFDEILKADPAEFRKKILENQKFFEGLGGFHFDNTDADNDAFLATAGEGRSPYENNLNALRQTMVLRRAQLAMQKAPQDNQLLVDIISAAPNLNQVRDKLVTHPDAKATFGDFKTIYGWSSTGTATIPDHNAQLIVYEAQVTFLLRKINACTDFTKIDKLITSRDDADFQNAAVALGYPLVSVNQLNGNVFGAIKREAAKQHFVLALEKHDPNLLLEDALYLLGPKIPQEVPPAHPDANFMHHYPHVHQDDIPWAKGLLGERFLKLEIGTSTDLKQLEQIASEKTAAGAIGVLGAIKKDRVRLNNEENKVYNRVPLKHGDYMAWAVTDKTLAGIRQVAASRALQLQIEQTSDKEVLKDLMGAKKADDIKKILKRSVALGFNTNDDFCDAFADDKAVKSIVGAAHVRYSLLSAQPDKLKELIAPNVAATYSTHFVKPNTPVEVTAGITEHLSDEENVTRLREEALIAYAKTNLSKLDDEELISLVELDQDANNVQAGAQRLLGNNNADDLLAGLPHLGISERLRAYAAADVLRRGSKDAKATYNDLKSSINSFNLHEPYKTLVSSALPIEDQHALKLDFAKEFIRKYPSNQPIAAITALAEAKTLDDFRLQLNTLGITELGWVDEAAMTTLQKEASLVVAKTYIESDSHFTSAEHPHLIALLAQLDLKKLQLLITKPEVISALIQADNDEKIKDILADKTVDTKLLIAENKRLNALSHIENSEVAWALAKIVPPVSLTPTKIAQINKLLADNDSGKNPRFFDTSFRGTIKAINNIVGAEPAAFYKAFGVTADGKAYLDNKWMRTRIDIAHKHNKLIYQRLALGGTSEADKIILPFFLTLEKENGFTKTKQINELLTHFKESNSREEFIQKAKTSSYKDLFVKSLERQLNATAYKEIKRRINKTEFLDKSLASPGTPLKGYAKALAAQKQKTDELLKITETIRGVDKDIRKELIDIGKTSSIEWLNPAFRASVKKQIKEKREHFAKLARACDAFVTQYKKQEEELIGALNSLPSDKELRDVRPALTEDHIAAINERRKELKAQLEMVRGALELYKPAQRLLNGDPTSKNHLMNQGILKTFEEIEKGEKEVEFLTFSSDYHDYDMSELEQHLKRGHTGKNATIAPSSLTSQGDPNAPTLYRSVDLAPAGKFREHAIPYQFPGKTITSHYVELRETENGVNKTKFLYNNFPKREQKVGMTEELYANMCIKYSLHAASMALVEKAHGQKQFVLQAFNREEAQYLWAGMMIAGFKPEEITLISPYDPKEDAGRLWGYKDGSPYAKMKKSAEAQGFLEGLKEAEQNKQKGQKELTRAVESSVTTLYKAKLEGTKNVVETVEDENKKDGPLPTLRG